MRGRLESSKGKFECLALKGPKADPFSRQIKSIGDYKRVPGASSLFLPYMLLFSHSQYDDQHFCHQLNNSSV